jgi:hypothetical protein
MKYGIKHPDRPHRVSAKYPEIRGMSVYTEHLANTAVVPESVK